MNEHKEKRNFNVFTDDKIEEYLIKRLLELSSEKLEYVIKGFKTRLGENERNRLIDFVNKEDAIELTTSRAIKILQENKNHLVEKFHVKRLGIFGSYARGEQKAYSDIDIIVEFFEGCIIGLKIISLKNFLETILGKNVDVMSYDSIKGYVKSNIEKEVVIVWEEETSGN
jgi:predicted nucleotidyltransferase